MVEGHDKTIVCGRCNKRVLGKCVKYLMQYKCSNCGVVNNVLNISLKEWLGFDYSNFLSSIIAFIDKDGFDNLKAKDKFDLQRGMLSEKQINELKEVLIEGFDKGQSIRDIRDNIRNRVGVKDLKIFHNDEFKRSIPKALREIMIARTETTRASNEGAVMDYRKAGVKYYRWIAAFSDRTCPDCEALNGEIFEIGKGNKPPLHVNCRCSVSAVTELDFM